MLYYNGRIYVRTPEDKAKPFHVIKPDTLSIDEDFSEIKLDDKEDAKTMAFGSDFDKTTGRKLAESPFFTDGTYFYLVSLLKETVENAEEDEEAPIALVLEQYDPSKETYPLIKSVKLYNND